MLQNQKLILSVVFLSAGWYLLSGYQNDTEAEIKQVNEIVADWKSKGDFFDYRGNQIFYIDLKNDKEPLLVFHGFPTCSWDYLHLLPNLTNRFHVVLFDMIGFGLSAKPENYTYSLVDQADIAMELLNKLNIREFHILAHDYGVSVAQEVLARVLNNERETEGRVVKSVAFLNGGLFAALHRPLFIQKLFLNPIVGPYVHYVMGRSSFTSTLKKIFGPETPPTKLEIMCFWAFLNHNNGLRIFHKLLGYIPERKLNEKRWTDVIAHPRGIPMRFINGPHDPVSGAHMAEEYRKVAPMGGDVVLLNKNIGHYPQVEDPHAVDQALKEFWEKVPTR